MVSEAELQAIVGPTGFPGMTHLLSTYDIGDEILVTSNCDNFPNPICGTWELVTPLDRDPTVPVGEGEDDGVWPREYGGYCMDYYHPEAEAEDWSYLDLKGPNREEEG